MQQRQGELGDLYCRPSSLVSTEAWAQHMCMLTVARLWLVGQVMSLGAEACMVLVQKLGMM